jgi:GNAT superfamily N-acetyltransferase
MLRLAEEVFAVHDDPTQLQVDNVVLDRLHRLHPATRGEIEEGDGPVAWVLLIPTTLTLMRPFLAGDLSEQELYERTPEGAVYDAIYLCSALVLKEHRRKGSAKRLAAEAIESIRDDHPIQALFGWPFTAEGAALAQIIADEAGLPLWTRPR